MKPIAVLRKFFGYRPGEGLKDFGEEIKQLTQEEKMELAEPAARELGVELDLSNIFTAASPDSE
jgi:hypothetical protein